MNTRSQTQLVLIPSCIIALSLLAAIIASVIARSAGPRPPDLNDLRSLRQESILRMELHFFGWHAIELDAESIVWVCRRAQTAQNDRVRSSTVQLFGATLYIEVRDGATYRVRVAVSEDGELLWNFADEGSLGSSIEPLPPQIARELARLRQLN